ncbi:MAG: alpha-L-rhamnosidase N-terminal domain-containing protein [Verrucomicrobiae bacterium]
MNRISLFTLSALLLASLATLQAVEVNGLRCENLNNPLGIDAEKPVLNWVITSARRGERQTAYQALVASTPELLSADKSDLWDSGKVASDQSIQIEYAGKPLASRMRCYWKVRIWDKDGKPTAWSAPAKWTIGLLGDDDWSAKWITASKWFTPPDLHPSGLIVSVGGWADVDLGQSYPIDSIKLYFSDTNTAPKRFKILGADDLQFSQPQVLVDQSAAVYRPNRPGPQVFPVSGAKFRHIRLWLRGTSSQNNAMLRQIQTGPRPPTAEVSVRQMEVMSGGRNVALMRPTREIGTQWSYGHAAFLVDGMPSASDGNECPPDACPTTAAPILRGKFTVQKPVKQATMYVAALGMADVTINGRPVTDTVLGPPFTDYTKRVVYLTHDITSFLINGENVIGATLGNGFFSTPRHGFGARHGGHGSPRVLIQAEIEYADGTRETVISDGTWKWSRSEIVDNDTFAAYTEDRRLAKPGWERPSYDDSGWLPVAISSSLGGKLVSPIGPPIRVAGELKPERVTNNRAYFKVLSAGWPHVKVNGHAGQTITILGHAPGYNAPPLTFTLATNGPAVLEPRFMYLSGPLEIEVKGLSAPLAPDAVTFQLVHADLKMAGTFACSNPWFNQIYAALLQTHLNYDGDQPMDPMREKQGWTQDMQGMFETAAYLTDVAGIYRKWWWDFADGQDESGYLGSVLPLVGRQVNDWNSPWWSGVVVLLPWQHYQYYGDRRMLAESYDTMRRYVDFLGKLTASGSVRGWDDYPYLNTGNTNSTEARKGILSWMGAGDWQNPYGGKDAVPAPLLDMPAWYHYATIVSETAALLGKNDEAKQYAAIAEGVKNRFNEIYLNRETGLYGRQTNSQTAQVLPLGLGVVPAALRELTYQQLLATIHARKDHLGTGFVGLPFLLATLTNHRESALANKIVNQQDYPSWKTLIHDGVLAEGWNGGGAQMPSCGGAIGMWLYQSVLGIRPDPAGPGFKKFILAPQPDLATGLTSAHGNYDSVHGRIASDWKCENGNFALQTVIPPNTTATVYVPTKDANSVTESGKPAAQAEGVEFLRMENNAAVYAVVSGNYRFQSKLP